MKTTTRTLLATLLIASIAVVMGCQKSAPKGAHKIDDNQSGAAAQQEGALAVADDGSFTVGPLTGTLPQGWSSQPPASGMRKAEFLIANPKENGLPGIVTVFYFGSNAGSVEMNIDRWVGQFTQADGSPLTPDMVTRESFTSNDLEITFVSFAGTMGASNMGGMQMHAMSDWMNISGIVNTPQGPWFFKGTGPEALMTAQTNSFKEMLKSFSYDG